MPPYWTYERDMPLAAAMPVDHDGRTDAAKQSHDFWHSVTIRAFSHTTVLIALTAGALHE